MTKFEIIMTTYISEADMVSKLINLARENALARIIETEKAALFAEASDWLAADLARQDSALAALDDEISALAADLAEKKKIYNDLQTAYNKTPFELKTDQAGYDCEIARRAMIAVTDRLNHLNHERNGTWESRQMAAGAAAAVGS